LIIGTTDNAGHPEEKTQKSRETNQKRKNSQNHHASIQEKRGKYNFLLIFEKFMRQ
jgi:hypothetical protein